MTDIYIKHLGTDTGFSGTILDRGNNAFDFIGDNVRYKIDAGVGTDTYWGAIAIKDHEDVAIVTGILPGYYSGSTETFLPPIALFSATYTPDNVKLVWRDNPIGVGTRSRQATFSIEGKTLKIEYKALNAVTSQNGNYAGLFCGYYPTALPNFAVMEMQGCLSTPLISYETTSGTTQYLGNMIDMTKSHSSNYNLIDPKILTDVSKYAWSWNTVGHYLTDENTQIMPFNETIFITNSSKASDCFVTNNAQKAPHFNTLIKSPLINFVVQKDENNWINCYNYIDKVYNDWGLDNAIVKFSQLWTDISFTSGVQANGMDWYPAGGDTGGTYNFADVSNFIVTGAQYYSCPYGYWGHSKADTPSFTTGHIALDETGAFMENVFSSPSNPSYITKEEELTGYLEGVYNTGIGAANGEPYGGLREMITGYGVNSVFYDVTHYAAPNQGGGFSCERRSGAPTRTLSGLIEQRHIWSASGTGMVNGPAVGEGSRVSWYSDQEFLWSNIVSTHEGWFNSNSSTDEGDATADSNRSMATYIIVPEYAWKVRNKIGVAITPNPARFFATGEFEASEFIDDSEQPTQITIYPYNRKMNDTIRCYQLLYGKTGGVYVNNEVGFWSNQEHAYYQHKKDHLKEFYLMNPILRACRDAEAPEITYIQSDTIGEETFEELYERKGLRLGFSNVKVHLKFQNKFDVFVNRSPTSWVNPIDVGTRITIPPNNGYFAVGIVDGRQYMGGSVITDMSQNKRVDFSYIPGEYLLADGRDQLETFMGLTLTNGKLVFKHMRKNFTLSEDISEEINRTEEV